MRSIKNGMITNLVLSVATILYVCDSDFSTILAAGAGWEASQSMESMKFFTKLLWSALSLINGLVEQGK